MRFPTTIVLIVLGTAAAACGHSATVPDAPTTESAATEGEGPLTQTGTSAAPKPEKTTNPAPPATSDDGDATDTSTAEPEKGDDTDVDPPVPYEVTDDPALNRGVYFCTVACRKECKVDCSTPSGDFSERCTECMTDHLPDCDEDGICKPQK